MKDYRNFTDFLHFLICAGAGVVKHHAPALRCFVINIGGNDVGMMQAFIRQNLNTFTHVVHTTVKCLHLAYALGQNPKAAIRKHGLKSGPNRATPNQSRPAGMDTHNVFCVSPASHQFFKISAVQGLIKSGFNRVSRETHNGRWFFSFGHGGVR